MVLKKRNSSSHNTFAVALKHAERELAAKLKERVEAQNVVGRLNYEIPNLQNMVHVLQAQLNPQALPTQMLNGPLAPAMADALPPVKEVEPGMGSIPANADTISPATVPDIESVIPETMKEGWK